jgi:hypothetical protein
MMVNGCQLPRVAGNARSCFFYEKLKRANKMEELWEKVKKEGLVEVDMVSRDSRMGTAD